MLDAAIDTALIVGYMAGHATGVNSMIKISESNKHTLTEKICGIAAVAFEKLFLTAATVTFGTLFCGIIAGSIVGIPAGLAALPFCLAMIGSIHSAFSEEGSFVGTDMLKQRERYQLI